MAESKKEIRERAKEMKKKIKADSNSFWKDFRKFITKGNVLDLAIAVVIGSAFSAITNGLVKFIINPVISLLTNGVSLDGWKTVLHPEELDEAGEVVSAEVAILWGEWIQTIIQFFIIAFCIFVAARIIRRVERTLRYRELKAKEEAEAKKKAEEKAKADAAAAEAAREREALQQLYANVARQTELLEQIAKSAK